MYNNVLDIPTACKPDKIKNAADGKTYWVYNVSKGKDSYSQRKSQYSYKYRNYTTNGFSFCNVHVLGMGLIYSGIYDRFKSEVDKKYPELPRLPDKLAKYLIESKEMREYYAKRFPAFNKDFVNGVKGATSPNEVHNSLSWGVNRFFDCPVTIFSTHVCWEDIISDIMYYNSPVGVSGKFAGLNHIVLVVGVAYKELNDGSEPGKCQRPDYIIVDDPFGKTYEYDKGLSGNDIWIPFDKCVADFKSLDNPYFKFAHRFVRAEYLGV